MSFGLVLCTITAFNNPLKCSMMYNAGLLPKCSLDNAMPIGILSGYGEKRQQVRDTWGKDQCVFFIVGKKNGVWPKEEALREKDMLLVDMEEQYSVILSYKTALWFHFAHKWFPHAPYVLKVSLREMMGEICLITVMAYYVSVIWMLGS